MLMNGLSASNVVVGVHGGFGIERSLMTPDFDRRVREGLTEALQAGYQASREAGSMSLDTVEAAVRSLENNPVFNAGRGSVFNHEGKNELDASIMEGANKLAGAISCVTCIKNPITAARSVMEKSGHVFLAGQGAENFAREQGIEMVDAHYFWTDERWQELQEVLKNSALSKPRQWGTVGAVAVDASGTVAAATSTGGMVNKRYGRVGDSPIIGAGTYADNRSGAVSATGHGEFFIRFAVAHEILSLVQYRGLSIAEAAEEVVGGQLKKAGGEGAVIALDPRGNFVMARNCEALYRGYATRDGSTHVFIYED